MSRVTTSNREKFFVIVGGLFFAGVVISAWIPQPCPILRNALFGCPGNHAVAPLTGDAAELARVPSKVITGNAADFSVPDQNYRSTTEVLFEFWADTSHDFAYLQVMEGGNFKNIALISHPLLTSLTWQRIADVEPTISLYQQSPTYDGVASILKSMPAKNTVAADEAAAEALKLSPDSYTPLEDLLNLSGISYILTTYIPREPDGSWLKFDQQFDLTNADTTNTTLSFRVFKPINKSATLPFRMSSVHVNYQQRLP